MDDAHAWWWVVEAEVEVEKGSTQSFDVIRGR